MLELILQTPPPAPLTWPEAAVDIANIVCNVASLIILTYLTARVGGVSRD